MKNLVLILGLCLSTSVIAQTSADGSNETTTFTETKAGVLNLTSEVIDYGTIKQGTNGEREFIFKNTGNEPIVIKSVRGSCGCTVPEAPKAPILPGESATIKVNYDTKRLGHFQKSVTITSNASEPIKVVRIQGNVIKV